MLDFIKEHKSECIILLGWITFLNIYKICFHVVGVDTEQALIDLSSNLNWTIGSGRFASALFRWLMMPTGFNYDIAVLYTIIGWLAVCIGYMYCFEKLGLCNRVFNTFFCLLFISCPIWAEQSYFVCSVFVNVYGMFFTVIAAFLFVSSITYIGSLKKFLIAMLLSVFAIGIYQAHLYMLVANFIIFLTLRCYQNNESIQKYFIDGLKGVGAAFCSAVIYMICSKVVSAVCYEPSFDYAGYTDAGGYISGRIKWFTGDFGECIDNINTYIQSSISSDYTYGFPIYPVIFCVLLILLLYKIVLKKEKKAVIAILGNTFLFVCIFAGNIVVGSTVSVREQFVLPLFIPFCLSWILYEIQSMEIKKLNNKLVTTILATCCFYMVIIWGGRHLLINRTDYVRYQNDTAYAECLMEEIKECVGDYSRKKIVLIGMNQWQLPDNYLKGEVIGTSVFSWDVGGPVGVNYRAYGMLNACGYSYVKPSIDEIQAIFKVCEETDLFIEDRIVLYDDDFIAINLNEF